MRCRRYPPYPQEPQRAEHLRDTSRQQVLLEELAQADRINWDRAALDSVAVPVPGAKKRARTQRIAANRARSAILWSTPTAPRSLFRLNRFRRLKIRYEHRADIHLAFLQLGCALISRRFPG